VDERSPQTADRAAAGATTLLASARRVPSDATASMTVHCSVAPESKAMSWATCVKRARPPLPSGGSCWASWSAGRGSRVAGRGSRVAGHGSRASPGIAAPGWCRRAGSGSLQRAIHRGRSGDPRRCSRRRTHRPGAGAPGSCGVQPGARPSRPGARGRVWIGHPQRDSNPCYRLERAASWAAGRWGPGIGAPARAPAIGEATRTLGPTGRRTRRTAHWRHPAPAGHRWPGPRRRRSGSPPTRAGGRSGRGGSARCPPPARWHR